MELDLYAVEPEDSGLYQCRRDKTILKNVFLQVVGNSGSKTIMKMGLVTFAMFIINLVVFSNT